MEAWRNLPFGCTAARTRWVLRHVELTTERILQGFLRRAGDVCAWTLAVERHADKPKHEQRHDLASVGAVRR